MAAPDRSRQQQKKLDISSRAQIHLWYQSQISNLRSQIDRPVQAVELLTMPVQESSIIPENLPDPKLLPPVEVDEMLTKIKHSHGFYYQVMNLEVWALVETLDGLFPGAWGQFMTNRQVAVKQFLQRDPNCAVTPNNSGKDAETVGNEED
jgi:hypothetical protein